MALTNTQYYDWIYKVLVLVLILGLAILTSLVVSVRTEIATLLFEVTLFVIVIVVSRAKVVNLVIAYVITDHLCQFFKRFIFLWGAQSHPLYYGLQVLPSLFIITAGLLIFGDLLKAQTTRSSKFLTLFAAVAILVSLLNIRTVPLTSGLAGLNQAVLNLLAVCIGQMVPLTIFSKLGRVFSALIIISVPYGVYQFVVGPTLIDQAWAEAMHDSSIEAGKVFEAMTVSGSEFRSYSYYADHTTWGLFLALAAIGVVMAATLNMFPAKWLYLVIPLALVGLVVCQTRSAWLALLGTLIVYRIISVRLLRRPMLLILGVLSSFAVVVTLGTYVTEHFRIAGFSNALLNRYTTIGTMEARTSAWKLFARNIPAHWLLGTGFGFGSTNSNVSLKDEVFSHNMYVELLVITGLPGLTLFLGFFYFWIREAFWVARSSHRRVSRVALWAIALAVGMLLTGSVQGMNFMNVYLCLMLGIISGEWKRLRRAEYTKWMSASTSQIQTAPQRTRAPFRRIRQLG